MPRMRLCALSHAGAIQLCCCCVNPCMPRCVCAHRGRPPSDHDDRDRGSRFGGGAPFRGARDDVPLEVSEVHGLRVGSGLCVSVCVRVCICVRMHMCLCACMCGGRWGKGGCRCTGALKCVWEDEGERSGGMSGPSCFGFSCEKVDWH